MYGFFGLADSPRPWLMIRFSCATVSCFPITLRAGTSVETPPRPRSPWHWAHANCSKSWAPAATLALTEVAPPFGTAPTTVTVFVTVFVPPQAATAPTTSSPHAIPAPSRTTVRARVMTRAHAGEHHPSRRSAWAQLASSRLFASTQPASSVRTTGSASVLNCAQDTGNTDAPRASQRQCESHHVPCRTPHPPRA